MSNAAKLGFLRGKLDRGAVVLMMASLISNLASLPDKPARGGSPIRRAKRVGSLFRRETSAFFTMQLSKKTPDPFLHRTCGSRINH